MLRIGDTTITVTPDLLGSSVPADTAVAKALTVAPNTTLGLRATVDRSALDAFVATLADRFDRKPADSQASLPQLQAGRHAVGRRVARSSAGDASPPSSDAARARDARADHGAGDVR